MCGIMQYSATLYACIYAMLWGVLKYHTALGNIMLSYISDEVGNMCQNSKLKRLMFQRRNKVSVKGVAKQFSSASSVFYFLMHLCQGVWSRTADVENNLLQAKTSNMQITTDYSWDWWEYNHICRCLITIQSIWQCVEYIYFNRSLEAIGLLMTLTKKSGDEVISIFPLMICPAVEKTYYSKPKYHPYDGAGGKFRESPESFIRILPS